MLPTTASPSRHLPARRLSASAGVLLALLLSILAAGCGPQAVAPATDFTLQDLDGNSVTLSSFKAETNVLVHFATTWCPGCNTQLPGLIRLRDKYSMDELVILSVDVNESPEVVRKYVAEKGIEYMTLLDPGGTVSDLYGVTGIPANFLIDKNGNVVSQSVDLPNDDIIRLTAR